MIGIAFLMFAAAQQSSVAPSATGSEMDTASVALADCYKRQIPQLDDHKSGADVIADAVVAACETPLRTLETAYKKKLIETARQTEGLSKREQDKLALELLQEMPQQFHNKMEKLALTAILRARASQE